MRSKWLALLLSLVAAVTLVLSREAHADLYEQDLYNDLKIRHQRNAAIYDRILPRHPEPSYNHDNSRLNALSPHNDASNATRRSPTSPKSPKPFKPDSRSGGNSRVYLKWEKLAGVPLSPEESYALLEVNNLHHSLIIGKVVERGINLNGGKELDVIDAKRYHAQASLKTMKCQTEVKTWDIDIAEENKVKLTWKGKIKRSADPAASGEKLLNGPKGNTFNPGADKKHLDQLPGNNCRTFVDAVWADIKA